MTEKKLTPRQERFVAEYLIDLNASAAARRAGYRGDANTIGPRLLADVGVRSHIEAAKAQRMERTQITQDRVLQELARIAFFDIRRLYTAEGGMKAPHELDDDAAAVLSGVEVTEEFEGSGADRVQVGHTKKAKVFDKGTALTLAMRHLGMLTDKLEVSATVIGLAERMRAQKGK
jgi:phage terminase small subunit